MAQTAMQKRHDYLTKTPVNKLICILSVPTIISMMVTNLYNMVDTFFVGRISTQATAAVGIVLPFMNVIQAVGFFCGHGSGNYVARKLGAGEFKEAEEMASTGFSLAFLLGFIILASGLINLTWLARMLGAADTTLKDTNDYLRIILIGTPFMTSQLVINNQLRYQGAAFYAMLGLVSGAVLNIFLDPLFIFTFNLEVGGAALATIISQITSFFILLYGTTKGANIKIHAKNIKFNSHYLLQIVNGGTPSLARNALISFSSILLNRTAGAIAGDAAIAGMSVVNRVMLFANSALIGFGQGYQPVCSYNYGAGLHGRVKEGYKFCVVYGTLFLIILGIICSFKSETIVRFFRDDIDVILIGSTALRWQMFSMPLNALIVLSNMMLQSIGKGVRATITASSRSGIFFIPAILIFSNLYGLTGVEIAQPVADVCAFILAIPITYSVWRELNNEVCL